MREEPRFRQLIFSTATVLTLALLYFFKDARKPGFFPRCPFHAITNLYCPGCGSQRAVSALLHADFLQAIHFNILLVISLPFLAYSAVVSTMNTFRKQQIVQHLFYSPAFVKGCLVLVIIFWILRNVPSYPFKLLAPHSF